LHNEPVSL